MKYKIGDTVIFISKPDKYHSWELENYKKYTIVNRAFYKYDPDTYHYAVDNNNGTQTSWYDEEDFITLKEFRKIKLEKLNGKISNSIGSK